MGRTSTSTTVSHCWSIWHAQLWKGETFKGIILENSEISLQTFAPKYCKHQFPWGIACGPPQAFWFIEWFFFSPFGNTRKITTYACWFDYIRLDFNISLATVHFNQSSEFQIAITKKLGTGLVSRWRHWSSLSVNLLPLFCGCLEFVYIWLLSNC